MVNTALVQYLKRRMEYGDSLSEIKQDIYSSGYSEDQVEDAINLLSRDVLVTEKVLSLSPKSMPGSNKFEAISKQLKNYRTYWLLLALAVFMGLIGYVLSHLDFSHVVWAETIALGAIYLFAFSLLTFIEGIIIYSIHQSSLAHLSIHIKLWPILFACGVGEIFAATIFMIIPSASSWVPIIIGCGLSLIVLMGSTNSNLREIISSGVIFCALTYFLFMLITKIYTREFLLKLIGLGG